MLIIVLHRTRRADGANRYCWPWPDDDGQLTVAREDRPGRKLHAQCSLDLFRAGSRGGHADTRQGTYNGLNIGRPRAGRGGVGPFISLDGRELRDWLIGTVQVVRYGSGAGIYCLPFCRCPLPLGSCQAVSDWSLTGSSRPMIGLRCHHCHQPVSSTPDRAIHTSVFNAFCLLSVLLTVYGVKLLPRVIT